MNIFTTKINTEMPVDKIYKNQITNVIWKKLKN